MQAVDVEAKHSHKVYVVDGSGYIFRAYYAVQPLTTKDGFPTNALFGFVRMLGRLLTAADSDHVICVFDAGKETFRNILYPEYKANRKECPPELLAQMPFFREFAVALGLTVVDLPGYEADDVIGAIVKRLTASGEEAVIVSADKDLSQLVSDQVMIWDTMRDTKMGPKEVAEKFGVPPDKIVEFLGLTGDSSDNIPGLSGVGPKTAVQLIEKFGSVEAILNAAAAIREDSSIRNRTKIADQIELERDKVVLSRKLVEIDLNAPVVISTNGASKKLTEISDDELLNIAERKAPSAELLNSLIQRFEFSSLAKEYNLETQLKRDDPESDYRCILKGDFAEWLDTLKAQQKFAFDTETTSLDITEAKLVGASFSWGDDSAFYIPISHIGDPQSGEQISLDQFIADVGPVLSDEKIAKIGQNLKYDISVLARHGVTMRGIAFDCMVASYLLNPDRSSHNLTALAHDYLGRHVIEFHDVVPDGMTFANAGIAESTKYACQDAHFAWLLYGKLAPKLSEENLGSVFSDIEMPLISVLSKMERRGVKLDHDLLTSLSEEFAEKLAILQSQIFELAGCEFNMNSPKQLSEILFTKLALPTKGLKKTKTGISTDSSVLEKLSSVHPLPKIILEYRGIFKLKSTYVDALPEQVSKSTGRLHSKFNQTVTGTGRLSSSEPNLQNIPIQTAEGRRIRKAFIADAGNVLISADYSQIELRLLAHLSGDANFIATFNSGKDVHSATARELLGIPKEREITSDERRVGKTINFGLIYGMGPFRLARELGIPLKTAEMYIENYFARYPKVKEYFGGLEVQAKTDGYVTTLFGRKRYLSGIDASERDQGFLMRAALNAPLQGTAADLIKIAMIKIDGRIEAETLPVTLIMQVHDELVFECVESSAPSISEMIKSEMEGVAKLSVPLVVDVGVGPTWQDAH